MKRLEAGVTGQTAGKGFPLAKLHLAKEWMEILTTWVPGGELRPVQRRALADEKVLETRKHVVVSAPTNSGKTLIGNLLLLQAVKEGRRAILVEPLRALAQEMADSLEALLAVLSTKNRQAKPKVRLTTGDFRLEGEFFGSEPPNEGEILVSTPERLEAILRNPANQAWLETVGAVVIDEAHLLGDRRRGPTLELLVASLLAMAAPPRICLLSATLGAPERLQAWLEPASLVLEIERTPPLRKDVLVLEVGESADKVLGKEIGELLGNPDHAVLVFVYQRASTVALARTLSQKLGQTVLAYHSGMSASQKAEVRRGYVNGQCRCIVSTTALGMGVNLPATHVYVRDASFPGEGPMSLDQLLQILGRAGRGDRPGYGAVILKGRESWEPGDLAAQLASPVLTPIRSAFEFEAKGRKEDDRTEKAAGLVAACLARRGEQGSTEEGLQEIFRNTMAGEALVPLVSPAVRWLEDSGRLLVFRGEDGVIHLTRLGERGVHAVLPLSFVAGLGQLFRDLLTIDERDTFLSQWSYLDDLILAGLLASDRMRTLRRFSDALAAQVDRWMEERQGGERSVLFREWIAKVGVDGSKADELMGSLGLTLTGTYTKTKAEARKRGYLAAFGALVLSERSSGQTSAQLESRFHIPNLAGVEESWRDTIFWLIAGQTQLSDLRCFFFHLKENCQAGPERIQKLKQQFRRIRYNQLKLMGKLKYCSPLGSILLSIRHGLRHSGEPVIGVQSIRRLEEAGLDSPEMLARASVEQMVAAGVQAKFARQIQGYLKRRAR